MLWGCFGWDGGMPAKSMAIWMPTSMLVSLRMSSRIAFNIGAKLLRWSSSRIMTLNTPVKMLKPGWQTMDLMSWCGLLNPLISTLLSIYGATSRGSLQSIRSNLQAFRSCQGTSETRNVLCPSTHRALTYLQNGHSRGYIPAGCLSRNVITCTLQYVHRGTLPEQK